MGKSNAFIQITTAGFDKIAGDFKDLDYKFKQKKIKSIYTAGLYIIQFVRQKIPQKKSGYAKIFGKGAFIKTPDGQIHKKKPTSWIKDKRVVGTSKAKKVIPENNPKHRWNKSSAPGGMPVSHPLGSKHQLKQLIFYKPNAARNGLLIYADPWGLNANFKRDGWDGSEMDMSVLEAGGSYQWSRRYTAGYYAQTIRYGASIHKGDGKTLAGKKNPKTGVWNQELVAYKKDGTPKFRRWKVGADFQKNKSGRTQKDHTRTYKKPHVVFRKLYSWKKGTSIMQPRPFLRLGIRAFIRNQWPKLWEDMCKVETKSEVL